MKGQSHSASGGDGSDQVTREELASVITALEPDQIISTKDHHHCPRRQLTRTEMILFWGLRIYLLFMVGVVVYQIWTGVR
ncbi:MAG: hypothetical protein ACLPHI_22885 [Terriglobales bacterium]|jgi:hypothetical protein